MKLSFFKKYAKYALVLMVAGLFSFGIIITSCEVAEEGSSETAPVEDADASEVGVDGKIEDVIAIPEVMVTPAVDVDSEKEAVDAPEVIPCDAGVPADDLGDALADTPGC